MAKQFVQHHQAGRAKPNVFVLLKKHGNKTADFGLEDGTVVCEGCPIGPQADANKSYVIITDEDDSDPAADLVKAAKSLRARATKLAKSATDASKAAEAAKGTDKEDVLIKAAFEAAAAAEQADKDADEAEAALKS